MSDIRAYTIGPKGENLELFRQLVVEALDDHLYWRRNFHPEDNPAISSFHKHTVQFRDFEDRLRDLLVEFLADAKRGVPFFSPRYVAHMNTDLLLPGLVGYFAAMLYNQNNVAVEASPMTARLEREVIAMLARMVGFLPAAEKAGPHGGYLCSGGTAANIYSLWVARNLRSWPLALRVAIERAGPDHTRTAAVVRDLPVPGPGGATCPLATASAWELWNLPIRGSLYGLKKQLQQMLHATGDRSYESDAEQRHAIDQLVEPWTLPALGELRFYQEVARVFPDERALCERAPLVVMASNKHYSFLKTLDLLGLGNRADGRGALVEIALTDDFTLDPEALGHRLLQALERRERVLAVVSTFGTTEEGSLDDLPAIRAICEEFEGRGLVSWLHVDACYGGYLGALIRADEAGVGQSGAELRSWMRAFACDFGLPAEVTDRYIRRSDEGHGWLTWDAFAARVAGMASGDSIAIDPHKLGYVPYPAGAVLLRDRAAEDAVTYDAPYLGAAEHTSPEAFVGRSTLEGSRPGAAAAACWLAHRAVPLSQRGHGKVLAASILATRELYGALEARSDGQHGVKIAFVNKPHTNMLCYLPYHLESRDLAEAGSICDAVAAALSPTHKRDFMVVKTTVRVKATSAWIADRFDPTCAARFHAALGDDLEIGIPVLRSVVMGPLALGATTRPEYAEPRGIFNLYAEYLVELTERTFFELRVDRFVRSFEPHESLLVVDDDPDVWEQVQGVLHSMSDGRVHNVVRYSASWEEARATVADYNHPLRFVMLGAGLGGGATSDADAIYADICARNDAVDSPALRVRSVVFLTAGDPSHDERRKAIERRSKQPPETRDISRRDANGNPDSGFLTQLRQWLVSRA